MLAIMPLAPSQSEDCLYLNIRTPNLDGNDKLPVMVWIHGGDHLDGGGAEIFYQSNVLALRDVVQITFNYRLGIMGYFAHPELSRESDQGVSGNYGTLDQIMALKWVQNNISMFGGNPDDVTIFGQSAGGESVAHMLTSPLSRGLFHKAIMQSPANSGQMIHLKHPFMKHKPLEESGKIFADLFVEPGEKQLDALREVPAEKMYQTLRKNPLLSEFFPNIDGYVLEKSPFEAFLEGEQAKVPLLVGSNSDEASVIYPLFPSPLIEFKHREFLPANIADLIQEEFGTDAEKIFELYPGAIEGNTDALTDMLGDSMIGAKAFFYAVQAAKSGQPAFLYFFSQTLPSPKQTIGAFHAIDVPHLFAKSTPIVPLNKTALELSEIMGDYWTQFAKTGNPNKSPRPEWPQFSFDNQEYMVLQGSCHKAPVERAAKYEVINNRLLRQIEQMKAMR
jgi:para-nitrobenzyl esterase